MAGPIIKKLADAVDGISGTTGQSFYIKTDGRKHYRFYFAWVGKTGTSTGNVTAQVIPVFPDYAPGGSGTTVNWAPDDGSTNTDTYVMPDYGTFTQSTAADASYQKLIMVDTPVSELRVKISTASASTVIDNVTIVAELL
jgi:hypothetical protein